MGIQAQPTLFDTDSGADRPTINVDALDTATDHRLDEFSSITMVKGFVVGHRHLLAELSGLRDWQQRRRWMYNRLVDEPRLTMEYRSFAGAPPILVDMASALSRYCGVPYDGIWMNWYRDNEDSTGWHADRPANAAETAVVPVVSLGATRRFLIRPAGGGPSNVFIPEGGDVLLMRGLCQRDWGTACPNSAARRRDG